MLQVAISGILHVLHIIRTVWALKTSPLEHISTLNLSSLPSNPKLFILIAGITGMVGSPYALAALARGRTVRGMGRNPGKVSKDISSRLESFVQTTSIYDIPALDRAVKGVDATICAYTHTLEVVIEGQLLLLRATERADLNIFHAESWNYDWTEGKGKLGSMSRTIRLFRLRAMSG